MKGLLINPVYPDAKSGLSPNSRPRHWRDRARAVKQARQQAAWLAIEQGAKRLRFTGRIPVTITVRPAFGVPPDRDNVVAACKAYLDGIADALDINDTRFEAPTVEMLEPGRGARLWIKVGDPDG